MALSRTILFTLEHAELCLPTLLLTFVLWSCPASFAASISTDTSLSLIYLIIPVSFRICVPVRQPVLLYIMVPRAWFQI